MKTIEINLKKLNENAKLPVKAHDDDFCYDVWAVSEEEIAPNVWKYSLGFSCEIKENYYPFSINFLSFSETDFVKSIDFRPRSSVWKTGMVLSNTVGTIDFGYRGEVFVIFYHVMPNMPRYKVGDKIGQIKLGITLPINFKFVEDINENTERGKGGFGSTSNT